MKILFWKKLLGSDKWRCIENQSWYKGVSCTKRSNSSQGIQLISSIFSSFEPFSILFLDFFFALASTEDNVEIYKTWYFELERKSIPINNCQIHYILLVIIHHIFCVTRKTAIFEVLVMKEFSIFMGKISLFLEKKIRKNLEKSSHIGL